MPATIQVAPLRMQWGIYPIDRVLLLFFILHRESLGLALRVVRAFWGGGAPRVKKLAVSVIVDMTLPVCLHQAINIAMSQFSCLPLTRVGPERACEGPRCPECLLNEPTEPVMRTS